MPTISLCMIAKDEEGFIAQCLTSVKELVSEIIVVDTGSSDRTIEIAKSFGARVFERPWDNDFAAARNYSLEQASGDWILVLDADEAIANQDHQEIRKLIQDPSSCYEFFQRHYSNDFRISNYHPARGEYPEWERDFGGYFESKLVRLFPNREGITYRGRVHELVEHKIWEIKKHRIVFSPVRIHHYGHSRPKNLAKDKKALYKPLGQTKIAENPKDWKAYFELAVEQNIEGRRDESVLNFRRSLRLNPNYVQSWTNLGYVLNELNRTDESEGCLLRAIHLDPNFYEAYCNLGVVYMRKKNYLMASKWLLRAVELQPNYVNALTNLGHALWQFGKPKEAIVAFKKILELIPNAAPAHADLGALLYSIGQRDEAEKHLEQALKLDPEVARAYYFLGKLKQATNKNKEARELLQKFCELQELGDDPEKEETIRVTRAEISQMELG